MLDFLKATALVLAGAYNAILAYEAYRTGQSWLRIVASAFSALALFGFSAAISGVLS